MPEIQIGGYVPFTTIDYPGKLAAVLFLRGCPLRCAYCSNRHLLDVGSGEYDPAQVLDLLRNRVGNAVLDYMRAVKALGFSVGLHTNGFYPEMLRRAAEIVDWVGLDFKTTRDKYKELVGNDVAYERMLESLDIWLGTGRGLEVRITCDPRFITKSALFEIADILAARGVQNIAIQKYIPHFDDEREKTTPDAREQFFNDTNLRDKINAMFENVIWRE